MKNSLSHLPQIKQEQILQIVEIIKEVVAPEMIILFGSYAKGTYVEHKYRSKDGIKYEYISNYDFLVVTNNNQVKTYEQESLIMDRAENFEPPINLEIHEINYINKGLEIGEYFFVDIVKDGIVLYDNGTVEFVVPRELTETEKKEKAKRYFDTWFPQAKEFIAGSKFHLERDSYKIGAFVLHQAAESLYYATLLVFTDYKPKIHNLWKLRKKTKPYSEELFSIFRAETDKNEEQLFDLLKRGYIDARYRADYFITKEELILLIDRVEKIENIVENICKLKIDSFESR
ncbi:MAG TPA: HEPN domain-containing protein [Chitinophagaceae bacterium]